MKSFHWKLKNWIGQPIFFVFSIRVGSVSDLKRQIFFRRLGVEDFDEGFLVKTFYRHLICKISRICRPFFFSQQGSEVYQIWSYNTQQLVAIGCWRFCWGIFSKISSISDMQNLFTDIWFVIFVVFWEMLIRRKKYDILFHLLRTPPFRVTYV